MQRSHQRPLSAFSVMELSNDSSRKNDFSCPASRSGWSEDGSRSRSRSSVSCSTRRSGSQLALHSLATVTANFDQDLILSYDRRRGRKSSAKSQRVQAWNGPMDYQLMMLIPQRKSQSFDNEMRLSDLNLRTKELLSSDPLNPPPSNVSIVTNTTSAKSRESNTSKWILDSTTTIDSFVQSKELKAHENKSKQMLSGRSATTSQTQFSEPINQNYDVVVNGEVCYECIRILQAASKRTIFLRLMLSGATLTEKQKSSIRKEMDRIQAKEGKPPHFCSFSQRLQLHKRTEHHTLATKATEMKIETVSSDDESILATQTAPTESQTLKKHTVGSITITSVREPELDAQGSEQNLPVPPPSPLKEKKDRISAFNEKLAIRIPTPEVQRTTEASATTKSPLIITNVSKETSAVKPRAAEEEDLLILPTNKSGKKKASTPNKRRKHSKSRKQRERAAEQKAERVSPTATAAAENPVSVQNQLEPDKPPENMVEKLEDKERGDMAADSRLAMRTPAFLRDSASRPFSETRSARFGTSRGGSRSVMNFDAYNPMRKRPKSKFSQEVLDEARKKYDLGSHGLSTQEDYNIKKPKVPSTLYLQGRIALSQCSSRFELPMDVMLLQTITPREYLSQHCIVSSRRQTLYNKVFQKHKDKNGELIMREFDRALRDVLINTISAEQVQEIKNLIDIQDDEAKIDARFFHGMCALAERILYPRFLHMYDRSFSAQTRNSKDSHLTEETSSLPEHRKERIESADFSSLRWKLQGVTINPKIRRILDLL